MPPVVEEFRERALQVLETLDLPLLDKVVLVGETLSIADVSCCGYLFWLEQARIDITEFPRVDRWLQDIARQERWKHPDQLILLTPFLFADLTI